LPRKKLTRFAILADHVEIPRQLPHTIIPQYLMAHEMKTDKRFDC
jgi:hypothetical protein